MKHENKDFLFTSVVLISSPHDPPLCTFCMFLLSLQMFVLFDRALWSGHHRIYSMLYSKDIKVCETWIYIVFIYRGILCHTSHFSTSMFHLCFWRRCRQWHSTKSWIKGHLLCPFLQDVILILGVPRMCLWSFSPKYPTDHLL